MFKNIVNNSMSMRDLLPQSTDPRYYKPRNVYKQAPTIEPDIDDDERTFQDVMDEAIEEKHTPRQMRELIKEMIEILTIND
jgi:hypothetical protein